MKKLKKAIRKYFKNPDDPIINELTKNDLEYIHEYMSRTTSSKKIYQVKNDIDRLDIFQEDNEGITYFRNQ